ncbi:MAG: MFS transporter [Chloroflexi bacterium]|nr:MAG: MFS transporter [Chloroflexota bacterium]
MRTRSASFQPSLLRNRDFLSLWGAQVLSQTAANALTYALVILVFRQTHQNTASSFLILLAILPAILFGTLAGVMVDRVDRKLVLVITNVLRGAAVVLMLLVKENEVAPYVVNFLVATVTVFFVPAEGATIPKIVRKQDLLAANSLFSLTFNGSFVLGFALLAPIVVGVGDLDFLFSLLTTFYIVAAVLCSTLPKSEEPDRYLTVDVAVEAADATRRDLGEAWAYLRQHPRIMWVLLYVALMYMLVAVAGALGPGFVTTTLELNERWVGVLALPAGVGIVFGLLLLNFIGRRLVRRSTLIHWGLITTSLTLLGLAAPAILRPRSFSAAGNPQAPLVLFVILVAFVLGAAYAFATVPSFTLLQEELAEDMRGRVFGVLNTLVSVVSLLPLLFVGPIADQVGVGWVLLGGAVIVAVVWFVGRDAHLPREVPTPFERSAKPQG